MTELDQGIREVLAVTFGIDPDKIDDTTSRDNVAKWDSLGQIGLVLALEEHFGVAIDVPLIAGLTSFGAVRETLAGLIQPST